MASSTRKWRKQQKEYNRRRRQATRRREEREQQQRQQNQEQKKRNEEKQKQNILSEVLGITSAVGYNKNVYGKARSLSKNIQSDYLLQGLREKKIREKMETIMSKYDEDKYKTKLIYAVRRQDPYLLERFLKENASNINTSQGRFNTSPLDIALTALVDNIKITVTGSMNYHQAFLRESQKRQRKLEKLFKIVHLLMERNPEISELALALFWHLGRPINDFLEKYPSLREESYKNGNIILAGLKIEHKFVRQEFDDYGWNSNGGAPDSLYEKDERLILYINLLKSFLETYNPKQGTYTLRKYNYNYSNQEETNENNQNNQNNDNNENNENE
jgi:hypothetical protein